MEVRLDRRLFLGGMLAATAGCRGQSGNGPFPSRDLKFIIPTGAGGGADIYARLVGSSMKRLIPQTINVIPQNVPSGGGGKGIVELYNAPADGYTLGILNIPGVFVLQRLRKMPHDFSRFTWLGSMTTGEQYAMAVGANSPIRDFDDLRGLARRRELTFATTGPEGMGFTATQISTRILGLPNRRVSGYRGSSDYVVAAMRGDTDAVVAAITTLRRLERGGTMRIIAGFTEDEMPGAVPNAIDLGQPELAHLRGDRVIAAPPGLPEGPRDTLADLLSRSWEYPQLLAWSESLGEVIAPRDPAETTAMVGERLAFLDRWLADLG